MRINKYLALRTGMSRRSADSVIEQGRVLINGTPVQAGQQVAEQDSVTLDGKPVLPRTQTQTILLHKPAGYVVSRNGQGSKTVYDLLPSELLSLKPIGRLDKDSSGLLLLTNDGQLANQLTHPSFQKQKVYQVTIDRPLTASDKQAIEHGVQLDDGMSALILQGNDHTWKVTMSEGRNRQIRRTFEAKGYTVTKLHRIQFGEYSLGDTPPGTYICI